MDVAMAPAHLDAAEVAAAAEAVAATIEHDLMEVELIQSTAEKQLASVNGLNASLAKKIRKAEAQTKSLLDYNKSLESKNAELVSQLHKAQDNVRSLSIKEARLEEVETKYAEAKSAIVAAELSVKKNEARLEAATAERDTIESELSTTRAKSVQFENLKTKLQEELEQKRAIHEKEMEERALELELARKEREEQMQTRKRMEETYEEREKEMEKMRLLLIDAQNEKKEVAEESQRNLQAAEARVDEMKYESDAISKQIEVVKKERDEVIDERHDLSKKVAILAEQVNTLEKTKAEVENQHIEQQRSFEVVENSKKDLREQLESKTDEVALLTTTMAILRKDHEELTSQNEKSESALEMLKKDLDKRTQSFEGERALLTSEKQGIEADFNAIRDRASKLEGEKIAIEKRAYELEENKKRFESIIHAMEQEKLALIAQHEREIQERIAEKEKEFEQETKKMRKELDDVVDRRSAMYHAALEREQQSLASTSPAMIKPDDDAEVNETGATVTSTSRDIATPAAGPIGEVEADDISGTEVPEAPMPFVSDEAGDTEQTNVKDDVGDSVAVMTRDVSLDDGADDDVNASGMEPGEGNTVGIISEEVMQEEVVDEADEDNVLEEVDEEQLVPEDEAMKKKKALQTTAVGAGMAPVNADEQLEKHQEETSNMEPSPTPEFDIPQSVNTGVSEVPAAPHIVSPIDTATSDFNHMADQGASVGEAVKSRSTGASEKSRRGGTGMLNRLICCVKVEDGEQGHTSR